MTPRQFDTLRRRRLFDMQCTELMLSRLTAAVWNSGFCRPKESFSEMAFMLHPFPEPPVPPEPPGDVILRVLEAMPGAFVRVN